MTFVVLVAPWIDLERAHAHTLATQLRFVASASTSVRFEVHEFPGAKPQDVVVAFHDTQHGVAGQRGLNTRRIGWQPSALTLALLLFVPLPWARRLLALSMGALLVDVAVLLRASVIVGRDWLRLVEGQPHDHPVWRGVVEMLHSLLHHPPIAHTLPFVIAAGAWWCARSLPTLNLGSRPPAAERTGPS